MTFLKKISATATVAASLSLAHAALAINADGTETVTETVTAPIVSVASVSAQQVNVLGFAQHVVMPLVFALGVLFLVAGRARHKRAKSDLGKRKTARVFTTIGLTLSVLSIGSVFGLPYLLPFLHLS
jgi:hypothetical protein